MNVICVELVLQHKTQNAAWSYVWIDQFLASQYNFLKNWNQDHHLQQIHQRKIPHRDLLVHLDSFTVLMMVT